jgi:hypothetical protein
MMSVPLEPPLTAGGVTLEPEWPVGAIFGLAVFGVDTYGVTVIPALETPLVSWGVTFEPPW